jgi:hypothetical protein
MSKPSQEEKLRALIEKAIDGGWNLWGHKSWQFVELYGVIVGIRFPDDETALNVRTTELIFDHDFARALFGEDNNPDEWPEFWWQRQLQMAVIDKDPIDYLYEEVFGEPKG